ncbi:porin family protein [Aquimarina sp. AU474]|uniref:porin family protein n=1 Tax=Aquimarina sp. AU474 TaxID=2108529 RepID=UPI000D691D76|nr:porin family protein [Aquimarina sp. AU474]
MNKIVLFLLTSIFITAVSQAQEIKFGVKGGLNLSTLSGDSPNISGRTSFHGGAVLEVKFNDKFALQPELLYSEQGASAENGQLVNIETKLRLNYINIPILAKYYLTKGLSVEAGPQLGILIDAGVQDTIDGVLQGEEDAKDQFKNIDFSFGFGLGYNLTQHFFTQARYNVGLSNVFEDDNNFEDANGVFQLSVGYLF